MQVTGMDKAGGTGKITALRAVHTRQEFGFRSEALEVVSEEVTGRISVPGKLL